MRKSVAGKKNDFSQGIYAPNPPGKTRPHVYGYIAEEFLLVKIGRWKNGDKQGLLPEDKCKQDAKTFLLKESGLEKHGFKCTTVTYRGEVKECFYFCSNTSKQAMVLPSEKHIGDLKKRLKVKKEQPPSWFPRET